MPNSPTPDFAVLSRSLKGRITLPTDSDYDKARAVMYGGLDSRPAAVVRVESAEDVAKTIAFARGHDLEIAVRSGGHSAAGHSATAGGIVIDVRGLNGIEIDAAGKTVWAGSGATAGQLTEATEQQKLVVGFGDTGSVGLGGITLGGGVGYLSRKWGLAIDNLLAAEIVTADGRVITADAKTNGDLFWALRGGGGNFGVVTRFKFALHDLPEFTGGMLLLPATPETIAGFVAAAKAAPEELSTIANVMPAPPMPFLPKEVVGQKVIMAMLAYAGDAASADKAIAPFRALGKAHADFVKPGPYVAMFPPEDPDYHPVAVSLNLFVDNIDLAQAGGILEQLDKSGAQFAVTQIRVMGGAVNRVATDATAYAHRDRSIMLNLAAFIDGSEADRTAKQNWVKQFASYLNPDWSAGYVNFVGDEGPKRLRAAYPGKTWDRLREVKSKYDPANVFRRNHNIPPAA